MSADTSVLDTWADTIDDLARGFTLVAPKAHRGATPMWPVTAG